MHWNLPGIKLGNCHALSIFVNRGTNKHKKAAKAYTLGGFHEDKSD